MSVLLRGMEMPENCICCDLSHEDGWCPAKQTYTDSYTFKTCPLVHVPPHGMLIEKNDVFNLITSFPEIDKLLPVEFMKALHELPTIIPAEEAET